MHAAYQLDIIKAREGNRKRSRRETLQFIQRRGASNITEPPQKKKEKKCTVLHERDKRTCHFALINFFQSKIGGILSRLSTSTQTREGQTTAYLACFFSIFCFAAGGEGGGCYFWVRVHGAFFISSLLWRRSFFL